MKKILAALASVLTLSCFSSYDIKNDSKPYNTNNNANNFCYEIHDENNKLLPGKIIIEGLGWTSDPKFGTEDSMNYFGGHKNVIYSKDGKGCGDLPPGKYEAIFARGTEYSTSHRKFRIYGKGTITVRAAIIKEVDTTGYVSGDFHVHAEPSPDCNVPIRDRIIQAVAEGLDLLVAADHNLQTNYKPELKKLGLEKRLLTLIGNEISTPPGTYGHIDAFPLKTEPIIAGLTNDEEYNIKTFNRTLTEIFDEVRAQKNGVLQVNHPRQGERGKNAYSLFQALDFDSHTRTTNRLYDPNYDLLEIFNGWQCPPTYFWCWPNDNTAALQDWFNLLNMGFKYTAAGNSDSHAIAPHGPGYPRNYVYLGEKKLNEKNLVEAIRQHKVIVTNGPFVTVNIVYPVGSFLTAAAPINMNIKVQTANWVKPEKVYVIENGKKIKEFDMDKTKFNKSILLAPKRDSWYVVMVKKGKFSEPIIINNKDVGSMPFAITNPIWVDADGNGKFDPVNEW